MLGLIAIYRYFISPLFANQCRFYPSCSEYSQTAFTRFGFWRGSYLTVKRLLRCHPFANGGIDHVPEHLSHTQHRCNHPHGSDSL